MSSAAELTSLDIRYLCERQQIPCSKTAISALKSGDDLLHVRSEHDLMALIGCSSAAACTYLMHTLGVLLSTHTLVEPFQQKN
jgi:hypothetical protein